MKFTLMFLKYTLLVLFLLIAVAGWAGSTIIGLAGIIGLVLGSDLICLLLIPMALFIAFISFAALDCATHFVDKWELKV